MVGVDVGGGDFGQADFFEKCGEIAGQLINILTGLAEGDVDDGELWLGFVGNRSPGGELFGPALGVGSDRTALGIGH